jgi:hypothetical protein
VSANAPDSHKMLRVIWAALVRKERYREGAGDSSPFHVRGCAMAVVMMPHLATPVVSMPAAAPDIGVPTQPAVIMAEGLGGAMAMLDGDRAIRELGRNSGSGRRRQGRCGIRHRLDCQSKQACCER